MITKSMIGLKFSCVHELDKLSNMAYESSPYLLRSAYHFIIDVSYQLIGFKK